MKQNNNISEEQEKLLNDIHALALNDDHLLVSFNRDQLIMAKAVIKNCESKFAQIAELIQVVCGD